jgi:transcriptional regulator with XRE-family HTH domain
MSSRKKSNKLGDKLKSIRLYLDYTLEEMADAVGKEGRSRRSRVYEWEKGVRAPDYACLLAYAKLANVSTDDLIDDTIHLQLGKNQTEKGQRDL